MFKLVVLSCVLAVVTASAVGPLGWVGAGRAGWAGPLVAPVTAPLAAPLGVPYAVASALAAHNYRGPLSLAPGQPANILGADGRPLDTLSVTLDRAAHYTAKAVDGARVLHKRSAVLAAAPVAWSHTAGLAVPAGLTAPVAAPLAAPVPAAPLVGTWGHAPLVHGAAWGAY